MFDALGAAGLRPVSLGVGPNGTVLSVFRDGQVGTVTARHRIDANEYQAEFDQQRQLGRRPIVAAAAGDGARQASVSKIFASAGARALHDDGVFGSIHRSSTRLG